MDFSFCFNLQNNYKILICCQSTFYLDTCSLFLVVWFNFKSGEFDDMATTRRTPALRAAAKSDAVPSTLTRWKSAILRGNLPPLPTYDDADAYASTLRGVVRQMISGARVCFSGAWRVILMV